MSGLDTDVQSSEYRNGNERDNTVHKVPMSDKVSDDTLKRGVVGSTNLRDWLDPVRTGTIDVRPISITLLDEARNEVGT